MSTYKLNNLFEPLRIGNLTLKNRIVMSPMVVSIGSITGEVTAEVINYYAARAKGGVSMVIVEAAAVDGQRKFTSPQLRIDNSHFIAGFNKLVHRAIHPNGALACIQLHHMGMWGDDPVAPSDVACTELGLFSIRPKPLTLEEIEKIKNQFSSAALRAKIAGFDMIELHGGTSYLLQQFVSPHTNLRSDKYGGSFENRIRLPLEIIQDIKKKCGRDFPVGYRMVADELLPDGISFEESKFFATRLEQEGAAYLSVQLGTYETFNTKGGTMAMRSAKGNTNSYTAVLKKEVNLPIFACQQNHEPQLMEKILQKGVADIIALGRPLLVDPELPNKIRNQKIADIIRCIRCCNCYDCITLKFSQVTCPQNPSLGREREYDLRPAEKNKKVLVVGGGPAGLEAARIAALRGHHVVLLEKEASLGGQLKYASLPIGKEDIKPFVIDWRERQCREAGVKIKLNTEATLEYIEELQPEVVIVATGAIPARPSDISISKSENVMTALEVLTGQTNVKSPVIVAGGNTVGLETADFLAENNLAEDITIIERMPHLAGDMEVANRTYIMEKLNEYKVKMLTGLDIQEIKENGIVVMDNQGKVKDIAAGTIVIAMGSAPETNLLCKLDGNIWDLYVIGDCKQPRKILDAIHEGAHIGRHI